MTLITSTAQSNHLFAKQQALFKAYDIRGAQTLFEPVFVHALAQAFALHYKTCHTNSVTIAHDTRQGSAAIADKLACALEYIGINVHWLGLATTPIMAYYSKHSDGCGMMVTASHSPKGVLGIKWLTQHQSPNTDEINQLYHKLPKADELWVINHPTGNRSPMAISAYIDTLHQLIAKQCNILIDCLVIDCLDGATAVVAKAVFEPWVNQLIVLNTCTDGQFIKGNPDPAEPNRLHELSQAVLAHKADLGLAFDGDGDRLAVVDGLGRVLPFDELLYFLIQASLPNTNSQAKILFDVKCLHTLPIHLQQHNPNLTAVMTKTGSSHLRRQLNSSHQDAIFAGELSGHFIFNDGKFINHDDGIYAAVRLLLWLSHQAKSLNALSDELPKPIATPDIYFALPPAIANFEHPHSLVDKLVYFFDDTQHTNFKLCTIDGLRLDFYQQKQLTGFGLIRASNTSHHLTVRFGANTLAAFDDLLLDYRKFLLAFAHSMPTAYCQAMMDLIEDLLATIQNSIQNI